jgi:hypothetical protein
MLTPLQTLNSFASRLSAINSSSGSIERDELQQEQEQQQVSTSLAPLLSSSLASATPTVTFPCLWLGPPSKRSSRGCTLLNPSFDDVRFSHWMSHPVAFENDAVARVPQALLKSVTSSFIAVLRQKRQFLIRNSFHFLAANKAASGGWEDSPLRLATLEMLAKDAIFQVSTVITQIRTLPLSKGRIIEATDVSIGHAELPLTFSVEIQVTVLNQRKIRTTLHTSGKIKGRFRSGSLNGNRMETIELELDTGALYNTMKERACGLVKIADKIASRQVVERANEKLKGHTHFAQTTSPAAPKKTTPSSSALPRLAGNENDRLQQSTEPVARCALVLVGHRTDTKV